MTQSDTVIPAKAEIQIVRDCEFRTQSGPPTRLSAASNSQFFIHNPSNMHYIRHAVLLQVTSQG